MFTFSLIWSPYTFKLCPVWQTMAWWSLKCLLRRVCWSHLGSSVLPSCSGVTLDTLNSMSYCAQPPHCASHVPASSVVWPELPPWCRMSAQGPPQEQITTDMGDTLAMSRVALWSLLTTGNKELDFLFWKKALFLQAVTGAPGRCELSWCLLHSWLVDLQHSVAVCRSLQVYIQTLSEVFNSRRITD